MKIGIVVILCSLLFTSLVYVVYMIKPKVKSFENNIYTTLISLNIFGLLLELCCCFLVPMREIGAWYNFLNNLFNRTFLVYFITWLIVFMIYIYYVSFTKKGKDFSDKINKLKGLGIVFYLVLVSLASFLPLYYFSDNSYVYSYGPAVNSIMTVAGLTIAFDIYCLIKNFKNIHNKKYYPLFALIIIMISAMILRNINPGLIFINSELAFIAVIMFFTIENPDLKMLNELKENRELIEKNYEGNANLLFNITGEVKKPLENIKSYYYEVESSKNINMIKENLNKIKKEADNLDYVVSNILDVSSLDAHNIKIVKTKYNIYNLLKTIEIKANSKLNDDVKFRLEISENVPKNLYGDEVKLKQILTTIIENSITHTEKGFIEVNVDAIIKYDVCRLIFTIEDSGKGMSLKKVNDLMSSEGSITDEEIKKLDNLDLNINIVNKITKLIGGHILIRSKENEGTKFNIIIEQKIDENEVIDSNNSYNEGTKKILLISDNIDELNIIKDRLSTYYDVNTTMHYKDGLKKLENNSFNLILIEDEMKMTSAINVVDEFKKYDVPVVVMLPKAKEKIKDAYIEDGFSDTLIKSRLKTELTRIAKKYL